ncbi:MAG: HNH endonuclease [Verrucomicrobia bacterium]|nr:HNH endonuclease [Verrucomicrobiota bacterium]
MNPSPATLTPILHDVFRQVVENLPDGIGTRLKPGRQVTRHGTRSTVLLSGIWDRHLPTCVVDPRYFKYEHVHDPEHFYSGGTDWYLQFYLNPNRIYQNPGELIGRLRPALEAVRIPGFEWHCAPNWIGVIHRFNLPFHPQRLTDYLVPRYTRLVRTIHPILIPILDAFQRDGSAAERAAVIAGRQPARVRNVMPGPRSAELSRSVSKRMRQQVLSAYAHRCARCRRTPEAAGSPLDLDHAKPVCRGGLTQVENLQPLCRDCHVWKGLRILRFAPQAP